MKLLTSFSIVIFIFSGCSQKIDEKAILEVYDKTLTRRELRENISEQLFGSDSVIVAEAYIKNWITKQVLLHNAEQADLMETEQIEKKTEDYKDQLLVHFYQNKVIKERLDTIVSNEAIKSYYSTHQPDFQLKDYLVKVLYIKVAEDAPELDKLSDWYTLKNSQDQENIIKYAGLYASNFYFDQSNWIYFDELTKEIPLTDINKDKFITRKSKVKFSEDGYFYFLNILEYKLKDALSPLEFEKENIKSRILNKRIVELRTSISNELLKKAENENAIKQH